MVKPILNQKLEIKRLVDGDKITFDSVHEGKRNCYMLDLLLLNN